MAVLPNDYYGGVQGKLVFVKVVKRVATMKFGGKKFLAHLNPPNTDY